MQGSPHRNAVRPSASAGVKGRSVPPPGARGWACAGPQGRAEWLCSQGVLLGRGPRASGKMHRFQSSDHRGRELVEKGELFQQVSSLALLWASRPHQGTPLNSVSYPAGGMLLGFKEITQVPVDRP